MGLISMAMAQHQSLIHVCQVGYLPNEAKVAMLAAAPTEKVSVVDMASGRTVLQLEAGPPQEDASSGDTLRPVDFSKLTQPGRYRLVAPGVGVSHPFQIAEDAFKDAYYLAMRSFYGQRCGTAVDLGPRFPQYKYEACHLEASPYHASAGKAGSRDATGGWHDAGDYGKYVVNSGITTATLLWTYELYEKRVRGIKLDIPESGRKMPDLLAEIKWNLDWMLKMQDEDGGVWHKATTVNFPGFVMPAQDKAPVVIVGTGSEPFKNTTATADLAAVAAIGARLYRPIEPAYADRCLAAARKAWAWTTEHPNVRFTRNPQGVGTGGYGDDDPSDEVLWAAAELFRTTGEKPFDEYFLANHGKWNPKFAANQAPGWPMLTPFAMFAYAKTKGANADAVHTIREDLLKAADGIVQRIGKHPYRMPLETNEYYWGSNSVVANYALMLHFAREFEPKDSYRDAALDCLHYLFGRNTFGVSFVTHVGTKWFMNPHHRPSGSDGIEQPWPGLLSGGPNNNRRTTPPPARQWQDKLESYTTNENAINWNAALVFVLAGVLPQ